MLEIGCGNLRGGWRFIRHLDPGRYYGIDISPDILAAAQGTVVDMGHQKQLPTLTPVHDLKARFMEDWEQLPHGQSKLRVTR